MNIFRIICLAIFLTAFGVNLYSQDWLYLGQDPPGLDPQVFPPVELQPDGTWWWHSAPVFSPAGDEMFFCKYYAAQYMDMLYMRVENGEWTEPEIPSFINPEFTNSCPVFSVTGDTLYFISNISAEWILKTTRVNGEWTAPEALGVPYPNDGTPGWQFSMNRNKDVYFEVWQGNDLNLFLTRYVDGIYQEAELLPETINTEHFEFASYISPDDDFILFSSNRPGGYGFNDIHLSIKDSEGNWTDAFNLGAEINTPTEDVYPLISHDNLYFFFTTTNTGDLGSTPYWVDSEFIYDLVTDSEENEIIPSNTLELYNYPNPFNPITNIIFQVSDDCSEDVELTIYNIKGQMVWTLSLPLDSVQDDIDKKHCVTWNGTDNNGKAVPSGIYYYKLNNSNSRAKKMLLLK
ncbi:FlgD immunoglobulin-like domain containing protein [Candidatus Cloacimonadota bacterium]